MKGVQSKICIISLENLNRVPYISMYEDCLKEDFDLIYWNRAFTQEKSRARNVFAYEKKISNQNKIMMLLSKLMGYIGFRRYVNRILRESSYKGLVVFPSNCCVLIYNSLKRRFKRKYIIEIRDYWLEKNKIYYELEKDVIKNSYCAVISSEAYKNFLPPFDYVKAHNLPKIEVMDREKLCGRFDWQDEKKQIVLSCIGGIKYEQYDKEVLSVFKNDARFKIRYIGRGYEVLEKYVEENKIENAYIHGQFPQEETNKFYLETDLILNLYGNNTPNLDYALSNKLYYSALFYMPILVCPKTYMAEIVEKYKLGFVFDKDDPRILDKLYEYYSSLDWENYKKNCERFLKDIEEDMVKYKKTIAKFEKDMLGE